MTQSLKSISCALSLALCATMLTFTACSDDGDDADSPVIPDVEKSWHLEWQDDFNGPELDIRVWSRIPEGTPDWAKYQSLDDRCYEFRDGALVLKGIVNDDSSAHPRPYLCGGIWTRGKKSFEPGRIAIRAKFDKGAQGAWPAIWMMPFSPEEDWPYCGEIDIMERLNHDRFVYQTLHSGYTDVLGHKSDPVCGVTPAVSADEYHIYEVYIFQTRVVLRIDGKETLSYPRINNGADGQYPYYTDWDLRIDMQLAGSWVGPVNTAELPTEMSVDWVRYYRYY